MVWNKSSCLKMVVMLMVVCANLSAFLLCKFLYFFWKQFAVTRMYYLDKDEVETTFCLKSDGKNIKKTDFFWGHIFNLKQPIEFFKKKEKNSLSIEREKKFAHPKIICLNSVFFIWSQSFWYCKRKKKELHSINTILLFSSLSFNHDSPIFHFSWNS